MGVSPLHIFKQGPVIGTLLKTGTQSLFTGKKVSSALPPTPGPLFDITVDPRDPQLIADYIRLLGGDRSWYKGRVPAHLFPQWGFPLLSQTLKDLPYNFSRILNAGCRMEVNQPLSTTKPLVLRANLEEVDDNGKRALITNKLVTGHPDVPEALVSFVHAFVPLQTSKDKKKKERPHVPDSARELSRIKLSLGSGLDFAMVTGDFNPVHWNTTYARMAGFKGRIAHGFSLMARAIETLNRALWSGNVSRLKSFEARFVKPLILPTEVGVYINDQGEIWVGDAPGGPAYLTGTYTEQEEQL